MQQQNISAAKVSKNLLDVRTTYALICPAADDDAVLTGCVLNNCVSADRIDFLDPSCICTGLGQALQKRRAIWANGSRVIYLCTGTGQGQRLIQALASQKFCISVAQNCFTDSNKMRHVIDLVKVQRTKIQNFHYALPSRFLL